MMVLYTCQKEIAKQKGGSRMKKVAFDNLVVGKEYFTVCGIWQGFTTYVGCEKVGSRIKYRFTFGHVDNWENQFGHFCTKSNIKVYEKE